MNCWWHRLTNTANTMSSAYSHRTNKRHTRTTSVIYMDELYVLPICYRKIGAWFVVLPRRKADERDTSRLAGWLAYRTPFISSTSMIIAYINIVFVICPLLQSGTPSRSHIYSVFTLHTIFRTISLFAACLFGFLLHSLCTITLDDVNIDFKNFFRHRHSVAKHSHLPLTPRPTRRIWYVVRDRKSQIDEQKIRKKKQQKYSLFFCHAIL